MTLLESVISHLDAINLVLFQRQYAIGQLILTKVGRNLKAGQRKGERGKGKAITRREGSLMSVCTDLSDAVRVKTGRGYSPAWFKYCYYYATAFSDEQYRQLCKLNPTQNALMSICFKTSAEIDAAIKSGKIGHDPRAAKSRKPIDTIDHGTEYGSDNIVLDGTEDGETLSNKFASYMSRNRGKLAVIEAAFREAADRVRKGEVKP